jgi:hypothetical protein
LLSDTETEWLCDKARSNTLGTLNDYESANEDTSNIFHAKLMKNCEGPVSGQLFISTGDRVQLVFAIRTDFYFFNPNGTRRHGNHDSIGMIYLVNLIFLKISASSQNMSS